MDSGAPLVHALALGASAAGGAAGAKMWPKDDVYLDRTRVTRS